MVFLDPDFLYVPSCSRHCTPVPIGPASVRHWFAVETSRPAALVDLQSAWRPSVATCCCRPATLEQSTCRRPVCPVTHNISSETEKLFISTIVSRHCFNCFSIVILEVSFTYAISLTSEFGVFISAWFFSTFWPKMAVLRGKIGERVVRCAQIHVDPNELVLMFKGSYLCATFGKTRSIINATVRVRTDRQTHAMTETNWIYNLSLAICYCYEADNKMLRFRIFHCGLRVAVNPLRPGPLLKTVHTCWIDAAASYANNDAIRIVFCWYYPFQRTEFITIFRTRYMLQCQTLNKMNFTIVLFITRSTGARIKDNQFPVLVTWFLNW